MQKFKLRKTLFSFTTTDFTSFLRSRKCFVKIIGIGFIDALPHKMKVDCIALKNLFALLAEKNRDK